jgi:TonB family protein
MIEAVTDIIAARGRQEEGLRKMVAWSVAAHIALVAGVLVSSRSPAQEPAREVMTISLSGAPGPRTGGVTQIGGRPVQAPAPSEPVKRALSAPAPVPPPMTLPDPKARVRPQPRVAQAPPDAKSRTATTGEKPTEGAAPAETQIRGRGFGLSSGGGLGSTVQLDVSSFCCQEYLEQMVTLIQRNWQQNQGVVGSTVIKFTIRRDGTIEMPELERPSGFFALDNAAMRALLATRQLPPLPAQYPNPTLGIHVTFESQR